MAAWEDLFKAAPGDIADAAGIHCYDSEHGLIGIVSSADVLALNRVIGLGVRRDAVPEAPLKLIQEYDKRAVSRFFVPLAPVARPETLSADLEQYGLRHYNNWIRLIRDTTNPGRVDTDLEIRRIGKEESLAFGALICRNFGWPEHLDEWIAATVGRPNWAHYMAFDGGKPVATAGLFTRGHCAWFDLAVTDESHRGRGAQSALLATRVKDAAEAGCDLVTLETAEQKQGVSAPSYRNAVRQGFRVAYTRPNYVWERAPETG